MFSIYYKSYTIRKRQKMRFQWCNLCSDRWWEGGGEEGSIQAGQGLSWAPGRECEPQLNGLPDKDRGDPPHLPHFILYEI